MSAQLKMPLAVRGSGRMMTEKMADWERFLGPCLLFTQGQTDDRK